MEMGNEKSIAELVLDEVKVLRKENNTKFDNLNNRINNIDKKLAVNTTMLTNQKEATTKEIESIKKENKELKSDTEILRVIRKWPQLAKNYAIGASLGILMMLVGYYVFLKTKLGL